MSLLVSWVFFTSCLACHLSWLVPCWSAFMSLSPCPVPSLSGSCSHFMILCDGTLGLDTDSTDPDEAC